MPRLFGETVLRALDANGEPVSGAQLHCFTAGTTTPVTTYSDAALTTPHASPVIADSVGVFAPVYVPSGNYKIALRTSAGAELPGSPVDHVARAADTLANGLIDGETLSDRLDWATRGANVKEFGALGNNTADDTTAIRDAIASGAKVIYFPAGTYRITGTITVTSPITLVGDGPKATVIRQTGSTANGIVFDFPTLVQGGGIRNLSIEAGAGWMTAGNQGQGSTGIGLRVVRSNGMFLAQNIGVHNFANGIEFAGCWYAQLRDFQTLYGSGVGLTIGPEGENAGAGTFIDGGKVSNFGFTGTNTGSIGVNITATGGEFIRDIDITGHANGFVARPTTGFNVLYLFLTGVLADSCVNAGFIFDSTNGLVWSAEMTNCWSAFNDGTGVVVLGPDCETIRWIGGRIRENGLHGVHLQASASVEFTGTSIVSNSRATPNTSHGVLVDAGVSDWALMGCRIGNIASTTTGQADNVHIAAGASQDFRIVGCDLRLAGSGKVPLANGANNENFVIQGNLPRVTVGTNVSGRQGLTAVSAGTVAGGVTRYLSTAGAFDAVNASQIMLPRAGIVAGFDAVVDIAPGSGQDFTYTVMRNGSATSMTGAISGEGVFRVTTTDNAFAASIGDRLTLRLVTSAGAATASHSAVIYVEP